MYFFVVIIFGSYWIIYDFGWTET